MDRMHSLQNAQCHGVQNTKIIRTLNIKTTPKHKGESFHLFAWCKGVEDGLKQQAGHSPGIGKYPGGKKPTYLTLYHLLLAALLQ